MTRNTSATLSTLVLAFVLLAAPLPGQFAYVANFAHEGGVSGYMIDATTGALTAIPGSPFFFVSFPISVAVDLTGKFAYVADHGGDRVFGSTIDATTGALTGAIPGSPFPAGFGPVSVAV